MKLERRRGYWLLLMLAMPPALLFALFALLVMLGWLYAVTLGGVAPGALVMGVRAPSILGAASSVGFCGLLLASFWRLLGRAKRALAEPEA